MARTSKSRGAAGFKLRSQGSTFKMIGSSSPLRDDPPKRFDQRADELDAAYEKAMKSFKESPRGDRDVAAINKRHDAKYTYRPSTRKEHGGQSLYLDKDGNTISENESRLFKIGFNEPLTDEQKKFRADEKLYKERTGESKYKDFTGSYFQAIE